MSSYRIGERQIEYLRKAYERGRLAHAYLFYGSEDSEPLRVAENFAKYLPDSEIIFLDTSHPLIHTKGIRKKLPIEDIRELKRLLFYAAREGSWRVAIINEADRLSRDAADALLKILEEPGPNTVFILITSARDLIPATIASRTVPIRFNSVGTNTDHIEKDAFLIKLRSVIREGNFYEFLKLSARADADEKMLRKVLSGLIFILREELLRSAMRGIILNGLTDKIKFVNHVANILETAKTNPKLALETIFFKVAGGHTR